MSRLNSGNIKFMLRAIKNSTQKKECPFCSNTSGFDVVDTKFVFVKLLRCRVCRLNFRYPRDTKDFYNDFYQEDYKVDVHVITDLPDDQRLAKMMQENFQNLRDYSKYINAIFSGRTSKPRVMDYGCSWGYNVFKSKNAGFDAEGFELSKPRAHYGEKLGLRIATDPKDIRDQNDVFFSSHVIEHLEDIKQLTSLGKIKLKEDGVFMAFCPNGSPEFRNRKPSDFHGIWGLVHPNYLDIDFAKFMFRDNPYIIMTGDWTGTCEAEYDMGELQQWDGMSQAVGSKMDGDELMIVAKPNVRIR